ncbi:DUF167 domain-containing protein [Cryptosporangium aurantiacum]|uniref:UPF0235 protein SAMN05443668_101398 n=1 Tax=Cryptosporangium aurantiacum TaxID=134849 RepID=A0A1M7I5P3_9ACTN|nr:DUF167 domain-containing protein [Cryptosporangium aurantiacum]SHM36136.1 hypothetical protein SAMN05443668_101398 [Cryptosporangium aurantiacum]
MTQRHDATGSTDRFVVPVRVKPGASRPRVGGSHHGPHGPALVVAVAARAVEGRATDAVIQAVAAAFGVRAAGVTLLAGRTSRDKLLALIPAPPDAEARLTALRDG